MTIETIGYLVTCAAFGLACLGCGFYLRGKLRHSVNWQSTAGVITQADLIEDKSSESLEYRVALLYEYSINGRTYTGNNIGFGPRAYLRKKTAAAEIEKYPPRSSVLVYYNPDRPQEAVLVKSAPLATFFLAIGVLALLFALAIVKFSIGLF